MRPPTIPPGRRRFLCYVALKRTYILDGTQRGVMAMGAKRDARLRDGTAHLLDLRAYLAGEDDDQRTLSLRSWVLDPRELHRYADFGLPRKAQELSAAQLRRFCAKLPPLADAQRRAAEAAWDECMRPIRQLARAREMSPCSSGSECARACELLPA